MANIPPIQFKRSHVPGNLPGTNDLAVGEIAINFPDGKLYTKDSDGEILAVGSSGGGILAVDSEAVLYGLDSEEIKHKEQVIFNLDTKVLLYWDSETDSFTQINKVDAVIEEQILFIEEGEPLPTTEGYYIFRSERKENPELALAMSNYKTPGDSDDVKGAVFYYNQSANSWSTHRNYEDAAASVVTSNNVAFLKYGSQKWSTQLQISDSEFFYAVDDLGDLTAEVRGNSSGVLYVREEQELYYWSQTADQTVTNGWRPFFPTDITSQAELDALDVGQNFTVSERFQGPEVTKTITRGELTGSYATGRVSDSNTQATVTWANKGGPDGATGDVIFTAVASSTYSASHILERAFRNNGNDWVVGQNISNATITFTPTGSSADAYLGSFEFYPQRAGAEGFKFVRIVVDYTDGHRIRLSESLPNTSATEVRFFLDYFDAPVEKFTVWVSEEQGTNGGIRYIRLGFVEEADVTTTWIHPGSYVKTGSTPTDYRKAFPVNVSTGTRYIKKYDTTAEMVAAATVDNHFEGGVYAVRNGTGDVTSYYEYTVAFPDTPSGTLTGDYNVISSGSSLSYSGEAALLADQGTQLNGRWYFTGNKAYLYNGEETGTTDDYQTVGYGTLTDQNFHEYQKQVIFTPEKTSLYYEVVQDAITDGYIINVDNGTDLNTNWDGGATYIGMASGSQLGRLHLKVPAGTSTMHVQIIGDRSNVLAFKYVDGNEELLGVYSGGQRYRGDLPGPMGSSDIVGYNANKRPYWINVAVSKSSKDRIVEIFECQTQEDNNYVTGIAYSEDNPWGYNYTTALVWQRNASYPTAFGNDYAHANLDPNITQSSWNNSDYFGAALVQVADNSKFGGYLPLPTDNGDMVFWFHGRGNQNQGETGIQVEVNGRQIDSDLVVNSFAGDFLSVAPRTRRGLGRVSTMTHHSWQNPAAAMANSYQYTNFHGVLIKAKYFNYTYDSDGNYVPTIQKIVCTTPYANSTGNTFYFRGVGFIKPWLDDYKVVIDQSGGAITNIVQGLDSDNVSNILYEGTTFTGVVANQTYSASFAEYNDVRAVVKLGNNRVVIDLPNIGADVEVRGVKYSNSLATGSANSTGLNGAYAGATLTWNSGTGKLTINEMGVWNGTSWSSSMADPTNYYIEKVLLKL